MIICQVYAAQPMRINFIKKQPLCAHGYDAIDPGGGSGAIKEKGCNGICTFDNLSADRHKDSQS